MKDFSLCCGMCQTQLLIPNEAPVMLWCVNCGMWNKWPTIRSTIRFLVKDIRVNIEEVTFKLQELNGMWQ